LAYSPANEKDGTLRRIPAGLAEGQHTVSYRRGYFADGANQEFACQEGADDRAVLLIGFMLGFDESSAPPAR